MGEVRSLWRSEPFKVGLILAGFVALGSLFLGDDEPAVRELGLATLLFFGGGGAAAGALGLLRRQRGDALPELVEAGGEPGFAFTVGAAVLAATVLGAVAMGAGALLFVSHVSGVGGALLVLCAACFGVFALLALWRIPRRRALTLTPSRVVHAGLLRTRELPWASVTPGTAERIAMTMPDDVASSVDALRIYLDEPERRPAIGTAEELARLTADLR